MLKSMNTFMVTLTLHSNLNSENFIELWLRFIIAVLSKCYGLQACVPVFEGCSNAVLWVGSETEVELTGNLLEVRWQTLGQLVPLFWISGDFCCVCQSQRGFFEIHLWCYTCRPLDSQHHSQSLLHMYQAITHTDNEVLDIEHHHTFTVPCCNTMFPDVVFRLSKIYFCIIDETHFFNKLGPEVSLC